MPRGHRLVPWHVFGIWLIIETCLELPSTSRRYSARTVILLLFSPLSFLSGLHLLNLNALPIFLVPPAPDGVVADVAARVGAGDQNPRRLPLAGMPRGYRTAPYYVLSSILDPWPFSENKDYEQMSHASLPSLPLWFVTIVTHVTLQKKL